MVDTIRAYLSKGGNNLGIREEGKSYVYYNLGIIEENPGVSMPKVYWIQLGLICPKGSIRITTTKIIENRIRNCTNELKKK